MDLRASHLPVLGIRTPDCPARSLVIYRLRYQRRNVDRLKTDRAADSE
jgi:hypothetical protein